MKISNQSVQNQKFVPAATLSSDKDPLLKSLQKQMENVQNRMTALEESKTLSAEQKVEKQKVLKQELESLQSAYNNRMVELAQKAKEDQSKQAQASQEATGVIYTKEQQETLEQQDFLVFTGALKEATTHFSIKNQLKGEAKVLASEIHLDKSRNVDTSVKEKSLGLLKEKIELLDKKIGSSMKKANEAILKTRDQEKVENSDSKEDDDQQDESLKATPNEEDTEMAIQK